MSLPVAGGSELDDLQGPFQTKPLCDSAVSITAADVTSLNLRRKGES